MANKHIAHWLAETGRLIHGGVTLIDALEMAHGLPEKEKEALLSSLKGGRPLREAIHETGDALKQHEKETIVAAAETGYLPVVLKQLSDIRYRESKHTKMFVIASLYPLFTLILCVFFAPMGRLFKFDANGNFAFSGAAYLEELLLLGTGTLLITIACILFCLLFKEQVKAFFSKWPLFKGYFRNRALAAFCGTLGSSLRAGISIEKALQMAGSAAADKEYKALGSQMAAVAGAGNRPSSVLSEGSDLPREFISAFRTGEELGELDKQMIKQGAYYDDKAGTSMMLAAFWYPKILFILACFYVAYTVAMFYKSYLDMVLNIGQ